MDKWKDNLKLSETDRSNPESIVLSVDVDANFVSQYICKHIYCLLGIVDNSKHVIDSLYLVERLFFDIFSGVAIEFDCIYL